MVWLIQVAHDAVRVLKRSRTFAVAFLICVARVRLLKTACMWKGIHTENVIEPVAPPPSGSFPIAHQAIANVRQYLVGGQSCGLLKKGL
jgi:hypothetical protein